MKLLRISAENFGSYRTLDLDLQNRGLCLVSGPTKSGKSTMFDVPSWVLYGITSKDGNIDDVVSWNKTGQTSANVLFEKSNKSYEVTRIRNGTKTDLYITCEGQTLRGTNSTETQKIIETIIGLSSDRFLLGCYLHQFSQVDTFFTAKAKDRRAIFELISDLTFPTKLQTKAAAHNKDLRIKETKLLSELQKLVGEHESTHKTLLEVKNMFDNFETEKINKIKELSEKAVRYTEDKNSRVSSLVDKVQKLANLVVAPEELTNRRNQLKQQLTALTAIKKQYDVQSKKVSELQYELKTIEKDLNKLQRCIDNKICDNCLNTFLNPNSEEKLNTLKKNKIEIVAALSVNEEQLKIIEQAKSVEAKLLEAYDELSESEQQNMRLLKEHDKLKAELTAMRAEKNIYEAELEVLNSSINPYKNQLLNLDTRFNSLELAVGNTTELAQSIEKQINLTTWIYDKSFDLRAKLLEAAKTDVVDKVNELLKKYFESNLSFSMEFLDGDKLEIIIQNNGNDCNYRQLSGGERCMLKLCFYLAVMGQIENLIDSKLDVLFFDESFNGIDSDLKTKAYALLQELSINHSSVFVVDHSENFKNLFDNKIEVANSFGISEIVNA